MKLTPADFEAIKYVAGALGVNPAWLVAQINFETAGTWDPQIKNPLSSARGLIQFTNAAASGLGFKDSADLVAKFPSVSAQLRGPVLAYYKQFAPFTGEQDFYFSVLLPKYRKAPPETVIYNEDPERMARFQAANPGIKTVGDYLDKLRRAYARAASHFSPAIVGGSLAALLLFISLGIVIWRAQ